MLNGVGKNLCTLPNTPPHRLLRVGSRSKTSLVRISG
jgi:hypothetical protein